jgi:hypothetical protein
MTKGASMAVAEALADAGFVLRPDAGRHLCRHGGIASMADPQDFFGRLPDGGKRFVSLSQAAHALHRGLDRAQIRHAVHAFVAMPPRVVASIKQDGEENLPAAAPRLPAPVKR